MPIIEWLTSRLMGLGQLFAAKVVSELVVKYFEYLFSKGNQRHKNLMVD